MTESGHRSWCFHYRSPRDGKRARATIGTYPATSLAAARGKGLEARGHVEAEQDPRLVLAGQATAGMTVSGLVDAYLADPEKAALRSKPEIERRLRKNVIPVIGDVKISELWRRDVRNVTDAILRRDRKVEATWVFEDVRAVVRWAVQNDYLEANPLDGMAKPAEATASDRVLTDNEIAKPWAGLPKALARSWPCARYYPLAAAVDSADKFRPRIATGRPRRQLQQAMDLRRAAFFARLAAAQRDRCRLSGMTFCKRYKIWTDREVQILRTLYPDKKAIQHRLPHRSLTAIRARCRAVGLVRRLRPWTMAEVYKLRKFWPYLHGRELLSHFPGRTRSAVTRYARRLHLRKVVPYRHIKTIGGNHPLMESIVKRANYFRLTMRDLREISCCSLNPRIKNKHGFKLETIAKLVRALDGELTITWK